MTFSRGRQRSRLHKHALCELGVCAKQPEGVGPDIYAGVLIPAAAGGASDHNCRITAAASLPTGITPSSREQEMKDERASLASKGASTTPSLVTRTSHQCKNTIQ